MPVFHLTRWGTFRTALVLGLLSTFRALSFTCHTSLSLNAVFLPGHSMCSGQKKEENATSVPREKLLMQCQQYSTHLRFQPLSLQPRPGPNRWGQVAISLQRCTAWHWRLCLLIIKLLCPLSCPHTPNTQAHTYTKALARVERLWGGGWGKGRGGGGAGERIRVLSVSHLHCSEHVCGQRPGLGRVGKHQLAREGMVPWGQTLRQVGALLLLFHRVACPTQLFAWVSSAAAAFWSNCYFSSIQLQELL